MCETFTWAGAPLLIAVDGDASQLQWFAALPETPTLVWTERSLGTSVRSITLDAWGTWPPPIPAPHTHLETDLRRTVDVAPAEPGYFLQSGVDANGAMTIAAVEPLGPAVLTSVLPQVVGDTAAVARGPQGDLLVHGSPSYLSLSEVSQTAGPTLLGTLGCASSPLVADAVALADGSFLVASSNNDPFDDCADPDIPGPATTLQVVRVSNGAIAPGFFFTASSELERVQLVSDSGQGAWLVFRALGDAALHLERLDAQGVGTWTSSSYGNALYGDAVADWSTGFVQVISWPGSPDNETAPYVLLSVQGPGLVNQLDSSQLGQPISVMNEPPTVLTSPDELSFLLAWKYEPQTLAVLRAECL